MISIMLILAWLFLVSTLLMSVAIGVLRRRVLWSLVSQVLLFKSVAAGTFFAARFSPPGSLDLYFLGYVVSGLVPLVGFVGIVVLFRGGRFSSSEQWDKETALRH
jgi:hypothetical protein